MILKIYTIRDNKAEAYNRPFFERTDQTALRAVRQAVETDDNYQKYAEDYALYSIGSFDDTTAEITAWPALHMANLVELRDDLRHKQAHGLMTKQQIDEEIQHQDAEQRRDISRTEVMMGKDYPKVVGGE